MHSDPEEKDPEKLLKQLDMEMEMMRMKADKGRSNRSAFRALGILFILFLAFILIFALYYFSFILQPPDASDRKPITDAPGQTQ